MLLQKLSLVELQYISLTSSALKQKPSSIMKCPLAFHAPLLSICFMIKTSLVHCCTVFIEDSFHSFFAIWRQIWQDTASDRCHFPFPQVDTEVINLYGKKREKENLSHVDGMNGFSFLLSSCTNPDRFGFPRSPKQGVPPLPNCKILGFFGFIFSPPLPYSRLTMWGFEVFLCCNRLSPCLGELAPNCRGERKEWGSFWKHFYIFNREILGWGMVGVEF